MMRLQLVCLAVLSTAACDDRTSPNGTRLPTSPTAPTAMPAAIELSGTVEEIGGGPVASATVSARSCDETPSHDHLFGNTLSDAAGAFRLPIDSGSSMPIGCVYVRAEKSGYTRTTVGGNRLLAGSQHEHITLRIQRLRRAAGRVVDVESGGPVPAVKVSAGGAAPTDVAVTDANGFFVLNGVGTSLRLDKTGFVFRSINVPEGQDVDLGPVRFQRTIQMAAGASLTGQISSADVYYDDFYIMGDDGVFCSPCKSIDLQTGQQDLEIRLQWSGEIPLALWAAAYSTNPFVELRTQPALPGESTLSLRVPAATHVLLVGVRSPMPGQQTVEQTVPFQLTAKAP